MNKTRIEWCDAVWNPVTGCTPVSVGCRNCYAARFAERMAGRCGYPQDEPFRVTLRPERLDDPLRWQKPQRVFVPSMGDLFHPDVPLDFIAQVFNVMACVTPGCGKRHRHKEECWTGSPHTFIVLTKRPSRMKEVLSELPNFVGEHWPGDVPLCVAMAVGDWPLRNVCLGISAENQAAAEARIPILLDTPAAKRAVSFEPLLSEVNVEKACYGEGFRRPPLSIQAAQLANPLAGLDWIIAGGESGPNARPTYPRWATSLRDQCKASGTPFFWKRWGAWMPWPSTLRPGKYVYADGVVLDRCEPRGVDVQYMCKTDPDDPVRLLDGVEYNEVPEVSK